MGKSCAAQSRGRSRGGQHLLDQAVRGQGLLARDERIAAFDDGVKEVGNECSMGVVRKVHDGRTAAPRTLGLHRFLTRLVALTISRTDFFSRWRIRKTLPIMAMVINPHTPPLCG